MFNSKLTEIIIEIKDINIDSGKAFDWGKVSEDYARFRDIYPKEIYDKIYNLGFCHKNQKILDIGTGTGVLPRNMYHYGGKFTGTDISENQIAQARKLSRENNMNIRYEVASAENLNFSDREFDVITACQCYFYFNHRVLMPKLARILKDNGKVLFMVMNWLPYEDKIAGESEKIILKYNPQWSGAGETRRPINVPECALNYFDVEYETVYDLKVHFTKASWHGRMRACRGVGASMTSEQISKWEKEHIDFLNANGEEEFDILHYVSIAVLKKSKGYNQLRNVDLNF